VRVFSVVVRLYESGERLGLVFAFADWFGRLQRLCSVIEAVRLFTFQVNSVCG